MSSGSDTIEAMKAEEGVPDDVYLSCLDFAATSEELSFRDVLTCHRGILNNGLLDHLMNVGSVGNAEPAWSAYRALGLPDLAGLLEEAHPLVAQFEDEQASLRLEELQAAYLLATYGADGARPDAVEARVVDYAQQNLAAFHSVALGIGAGGPAKEYSDKLIASLDEIVEQTRLKYK